MSSAIVTGLFRSASSRMRQVQRAGVAQAAGPQAIRAGIDEGIGLDLSLGSDDWKPALKSKRRLHDKAAERGAPLPTAMNRLLSCFCQSLPSSRSPAADDKKPSRARRRRKGTCFSDLAIVAAGDIEG